MIGNLITWPIANMWPTTIRISCEPPWDSETYEFLLNDALHPRLMPMVGLTDLDESLPESGFHIPDYLVGVPVSIGI